MILHGSSDLDISYRNILLPYYCLMIMWVYNYDFSLKRNCCILNVFNEKKLFHFPFVFQFKINVKYLHNLKSIFSGLRLRAYESYC